MLEWLAPISDRHELELRKLQREEADRQEAQRIWEKFYEDYRASLTEWNPNQPRQPKGTSVGGQWAPSGGGMSSGGGGVSHWSHSSGSVSKLAYDGPKTSERPPTHDPKATHLRKFDESHDLTLPGALKNGKLAAGDIPRIKFTDDEIKQILKSAEKPGSDFNFTFYTAENLPDRLRAVAERDFADLPGDEKYAMQAFVSNQRRARWILLARNPAFQEYVGQLYGLLRSVNPVHFTVEKGIVVATGKEPVLGGEASRLNALKEMLIYWALVKGVGWGASKISKIIAGPEAGGDIAIEFKGGGKLTIRRGAEYSPETLESSVERAAAGEKVTIDPPAPKPPRPSLTDVPPAKDNPRAFRIWFNELTPEELATVWRNPKLKKAVAEGLRWPGYQHEWLMIARAQNSRNGGSRLSKLQK